MRGKRAERPISSMSFHLDEMVQCACSITDPFSLGGSGSADQVMDDGLSTTSSSTDGGCIGGEVRRNRAPPFLARKQRPRPQVTLRYMQCLDGSLMVPEKTGLPDVSHQSPNPATDENVVNFVARLRSNHDAIVVGVNTVLRDNPRLLSGNPSRQPRPVILDTDLQFPLDSDLLSQEKKPWIFYRDGPQCSIMAEKKAALEAAGASLYQAPLDHSTGHLSLSDVLQYLYDQLDIQKATVEGGVSLLESFIRSGLFDKLVVLMTPCFGMGRALFQANTGMEAGNEEMRAALPKLVNVRYDVLGGDLVMTAEPEP